MARVKSIPVSNSMVRAAKYGKMNQAARSIAMTKLRSSKTLTAAVKRAVTRIAEKKIAISSANNVTIATLNVATVTPSQIYLLPQLVQGTAQAQRIGNKISVQKCYLNVLVNILPYNSVTNPSTYPTNIKYWVVKDRRTVQRNALAAADMVGFFQNGSSVGNFSALPSDVLLSVDNDTWRICTSGTKLLDFSNTLNAGLAANAFPTNDAVFQWKFYIDLTKFIKKTLMYDDSVSNVPTNDNLFIFFQAVSSDGTSSSTLQMAEFHYAYRCEYTDI